MERSTAERYDPARDGERRVPEPLLYTPDQLLGRERIRLRRASDRRRFVGHAAAVLALGGLTMWWVVPLHAFAGPVLLPVTATHGVHTGDLPSLLFVALALRSLRIAVRSRAAREGCL